MKPLIYYLENKLNKEIPEGWHIRKDMKPIPDRRYDYDFWHDEYDIGTNLCGNASDVDDAIHQINEIIKDACDD